MKKLTIVLLALLLSAFQAEAQSLQITSFWTDFHDLTAMFKNKKDINGNKCGVIRVQFAGGEMTFESNSIVEVEKSISEYFVWMAPKATNLTIKAPGYLPLKVDLNEKFGLEEGIHSSRTYVMVIEDSQAEAKRLRISRFKEDIGNMTASQGSTRRIDWENQLCGLIRLQFAGGDMTINGGFDVKKTTSEYLVWMTSNSRWLEIKVPGYLPFEVDFKEELGLENGLKSGSTYVMVIEDSQYTNHTISDDTRNREKIKEMIGNISKAYEKKDIAYLEIIFSENTSNITCSKTLKKDGTSKFVYQKLETKTFINKLKRAFKEQDNINLKNEILSITRHPNNYYSVRVKQKYETKNYSDEGIVFLAFNFSNKLKPTIDVRVWQPIEIPESEWLTMENIKQYLRVDPSLKLQNTSNHEIAKTIAPTNEAMQDVDKDIPLTTSKNPNTLAIIIANEDYEEASKVEYALNDGKVFRDYCNKTLGLPEDNIHFIANATLAKLWGELDWLQKACKYFKGEASVIFYYAGHGFPDEDTKASYLLPTDGDSRMLRTSLSLNELYNTLGSLSAKKVTVVMDACFSGANLNLDDRTAGIKAKPGELKGNMIVLSAAQGNETAYKYENAKHGLFTYFLLKKLKDTKGIVSIGELSNYVQDQVGRYSILKNRKSQTPTIQTSDNLRSSWKSLTFY